MPGSIESEAVAAGSETFLAGGGALGAAMRAHDWAGSPVGQPATWPQTLKTLVSVMLGSHQAMFVAWGPERLMFYNNRYAELLQDRHPAALGARFADVWWDILPEVGPILERAYAGQSTHMDDIALTLTRDGRAREAHFSFSYTPVRDEGGAVAGMFCVCTETTGQVLAERRREALFRLDDRLRDVTDTETLSFVACEILGEALGVIRVGYGVVDADAGTIAVERNWVAPGFADLAGLHDFADYGSHIRDLRRGEVVANANVATDPRSAAAASAFAAHHIRAFLDVPVVEGGCTVAEIFLHSDVPREWSQEEAAFVKDVAERTRAAIARREAEQALRASFSRADTLATEQAAILGQLTEGVIVADRAGRIAFVNEAATRIHGVARLDVEPDAYSETYHLFTLEGAPYPSHDLPLARAVRGEIVLDARWRIRRPDGTEILAIGSARPVLGAEGEQVGAVLTLRDDTERDAAERQLRENEARLRALTDHLPSGVVYQITTGRHGSDRRFLYVSQSNEQLTGVPAEAVLADPTLPYRMVVPEDRDRLAAAEAEAIGELRPLDVEVRFTRADGEIRWSRLISAPRPQPDGSLIWDGLQIDITDQKRAEVALRGLNEELERRVAKASADLDLSWRLSLDLLVIVEPDGTLATINQAWTETLGWAQDELTGRTFMEFTHPEDVEPTLAVFRATFETPLVEPYEFRLRHKDGSYRWLAWTATFEGGRVFANGRDTTVEKARQAELEAAQEALRQAQKMEAVGQLTGGIAHDFNNMLAVVIGSLDLLARRVGGDERARRHVDAATDGAKRAALLTQRLLAFSRQQPLKPEAVDVGKLVTGMSELLRGSLGSSIQLKTVVAAGGWRARVDPNQLENVLLNLAVNARDAMPDGGRLTIETQDAELDERYAAAHPEATPGQYVLIAVTDTGCGMAPEVIAKAFDPFFTTKDVGKGTGLGLSQVYGFVKQSGGHVRIYSEAGQGTTVKLYLPWVDGPVHEEADAATEGPVPRGDAREVVLVVEDEAAVRQFSTDALAELGYRTLEADGAAAALRLLDAHDDIALLFTDIVMPEVNGRKLADEARRRRPGLKVLFTTGYTRDAVVHNGVLDPGVELIGKPYSVDELAEKVRAVLDG